MTWEITNCRWDLSSTHDRLCAAGWEPFAVGNDSVWFRRETEASKTRREALAFMEGKDRP